MANMVYILVDENDIVRCMATEEGNLHADKLYMDQYYVEQGGVVGDKYDSVTETWTNIQNTPVTIAKSKQIESDDEHVLLLLKQQIAEDEYYGDLISQYDAELKTIGKKDKPWKTRKIRKKNGKKKLMLKKANDEWIELDY